MLEGALVSVDYTIAVLNSRLQSVVDAIDAGATNGWLRLTDVGGNALSSFQLARPMGVVANGILTFLGLALVDPAAASDGIASGARVEDGSGNVIISGLTVNDPSGTSDIFLSPTNVIVAGQSVAITTATITGN